MTPPHQLDPHTPHAFRRINEMPFFDSDGGPVYYRHCEANSPVVEVIILHGYGEHSGLFSRLAVVLTLSGANFWAIDHVGHGLSYGDRGRFSSVDELASNARGLIALARSSRRPIVLGGHSLGAVTAAEVALGGEELQALVLTGAPLLGTPPPAAEDAEVEFSRDAHYLDQLANDPLTFDDLDGWPLLVDHIRDAAQKIGPRLRELRIPVLMVNGERDSYAPPELAEVVAAAIDSCELVVVPAGLHDIINDRDHRFVEQAIRDFVHQSIASLSGHGREPLDAFPREGALGRQGHSLLDIEVLPFRLVASPPEVWTVQESGRSILGHAPAHTDLYANPGGSSQRTRSPFPMGQHFWDLLATVISSSVLESPRT